MNKLLLMEIMKEPCFFFARPWTFQFTFCILFFVYASAYNLGVPNSELNFFFFRFCCSVRKIVHFFILFMIVSRLG